MKEANVQSIFFLQWGEKISSFQYLYKTFAVFILTMLIIH